MRVLFEKNAHVKRPNASTTKILTAIVAIEMGDPQDVVTISSKAAQIGGSTIHLKKGEKIKLLDLLYGLMLKSGNDAAIAIAEHIGGTVEDFMKLVNEKARDIGANNTHFTSPHGLDNPDHYTTAYDLALITSYCMKNDFFRQLVSTAETYISERALRSTNDLLFTYEGTTGVKTGFTNGAGRCLVSSAKKNGMEVISVVLGCDNKTARFRDSRILMDYAFKNYTKVKLVSTGDVLKNITLKKGLKVNVNAIAAETIILPLTEKEKNELEIRYMLEDTMDAPVEKGVIVGNLYFVSGDNTLAEIDILIEETVDKKGIKDFFEDILKSWVAVL
jgi:D-alanyl-D-alanine carboxypeptidase (penicillin-binding protein 5/6)